MFEKAFQGAPAFEILSPQGANPTRDWKVSGVQRLFDKVLKGYVFHVTGNALMRLPREDKPRLGLVQPILVLQVYLPQGKPFSVEIGITDQTRTRRRLLFSSAFKETSTNPLHARFPLVDSSRLEKVQRNCWVSLCFDVEAMVPKAWPGQHYKTLDSLQISPDCRLRKVYTLRGQPLAEENLLRLQDGTTTMIQVIDGSGRAAGDTFTDSFARCQTVFPRATYASSDEDRGGITPSCDYTPMAGAPLAAATTECFGYDELVRRNQISGASGGGNTSWGHGAKTKAQMQMIDRRSPKGELCRDRFRERPTTRTDCATIHLGMRETERSVAEKINGKDQSGKDRPDRTEPAFARRLKGQGSLGRKEKRENSLPGGRMMNSRKENDRTGSTPCGNRLGSISTMTSLSTLHGGTSPNRKKPSTSDGQASPTRRRARPSQQSPYGNANHIHGAASSGANLPVRLSQRTNENVVRSMRYSSEPHLSTGAAGQVAYDDHDEAHKQRGNAVPTIMESPTKLLEGKEKELCCRLKRLAILEKKDMQAPMTLEGDDLVNYGEPVEGIHHDPRHDEAGTTNTKHKEPSSKKGARQWKEERSDSKDSCHSTLPLVESSSPTKPRTHAHPSSSQIIDLATNKSSLLLSKNEPFHNNERERRCIPGTHSERERNGTGVGLGGNGVALGWLNNGSKTNDSLPSRATPSLTAGHASFSAASGAAGSSLTAAELNCGEKKPLPSAANLLLKPPSVSSAGGAGGGYPSSAGCDDGKKSDTTTTTTTMKAMPPLDAIPTTAGRDPVLQENLGHTHSSQRSSTKNVVGENFPGVAQRRTPEKLRNGPGGGTGGGDSAPSRSSTLCTPASASTLCTPASASTSAAHTGSGHTGSCTSNQRTTSGPDRCKETHLGATRHTPERSRDSYVQKNTPERLKDLGGHKNNNVPERLKDVGAVQRNTAERGNQKENQRALVDKGTGEKAKESLAPRLPQESLNNNLPGSTYTPAAYAPLRPAAREYDKSKDSPLREIGVRIRTSAQAQSQSNDVNNMNLMDSTPKNSSSSVSKTHIDDDCGHRFDGFASCVRKSLDEVTQSEIFSEPHAGQSFDGSDWMHNKGSSIFDSQTSGNNNHQHAGGGTVREKPSPRTVPGLEPSISAPLSAGNRAAEQLPPFSSHLGDNNHKSMGSQAGKKSLLFPGMHTSDPILSSSADVVHEESPRIPPPKEDTTLAMSKIVTLELSAPTDFRENQPSLGSMIGASPKTPGLGGGHDERRRMSFDLLDHDAAYGQSRKPSFSKEDVKFYQDEVTLPRLPTVGGDNDRHDPDPNGVTQPFVHFNEPSHRPEPAETECSSVGTISRNGSGGDTTQIGSPKLDPSKNNGANFAPKARPFTPPVIPVSQLLKNPIVEAPECIEVMFDPLLDIYYDPLTNKYYKLKDTAVDY